MWIMKNRNRLVIPIGSAVVCVLLMAFVLKQASRTTTILLTATGFEPRLVSIRVGESITFRTDREKDFWPASNLHPSHLVYPEFDAKGPVNASDAYTFRFTSSGSWRYHDHLSPQFTGTVIVHTSWWEQLRAPLQSVFTLVGLRKDTHDCDVVSTDIRAACWEREIRQRVKSQGIAAAFSYIEARRGNADFAQVCHDLAHVIGREVFLSRKWQGALPGKVDYRMCDYGFFHGYMELMIGTGDNLSRARALCDGITDELNQGQLIASCYHGIGHGAVIAHELPGTSDPWKLVPQGITVCESASADSIKRENCASGVIDGLASLITGGQYPLTEEVKRHPFAICTTLHAHYHTACRMSFVGLTLYLAQGQIPAALELIERDLHTSALPLVHNVVSMIVRERNLRDLRPVLAECDTVPDTLRHTCVRGALEGYFLARISETTKPAEIMPDCAVLPKGTERTVCYTEIVRQMYDWKGYAAAEFWCTALPVDIRSACSTNVETFIAEETI